VLIYRRGGMDCPRRRVNPSFSRRRLLVGARDQLFWDVIVPWGFICPGDG